MHNNPLTKAYWRDATANLKDVRMLALAAMIVALRAVCKMLEACSWIRRFSIVLLLLSHFSRVRLCATP